MSETYNPIKNAELADEQNYNMIDGVLNNQPPAPEHEKEKGKVKEPPHKCRSLEREER